jgi:hypothetical protein
MREQVNGRNEYLALRRRHEPEHVRLIVVAESPPYSGLYFYDPKGSIKEPLFAALMELLRFCCTQKLDGLSKAQQRGWVLVDATYEPVNKNRSRDIILERDYQALHDDLIMLTPDRSVPLVLIKKNVCRLLEPKVAKDGFTVLNRGTVIPFPSNGWQKPRKDGRPSFPEQFAAVVPLDLY